MNRQVDQESEEINQEINDNDSFKKFMYKIICQCEEQCLKQSNTDYKSMFKQKNCTEIQPFPLVLNKHFYDEKIQEILNYFISSNILLKIGKKYYIKNNKITLKLTWENIKTLTGDDNIELQKLLWLLRKSIVDLLLKQIHTELKLPKDFKIYSVGSNKITSDYDITLYGNSIDKGNVIKEFDMKFKELFFENSSIVFDTNIYGKSFIDFQKNDLSTEWTCETKEKKESIYILNESSQDSQLFWALVKYFQDIRVSFGEKILYDWQSYLFTSIDIPHIKNALETRIYLNNKDFKTEYFFSNVFEAKFLNKYFQLVAFLQRKQTDIRYDKLIDNKIIKKIDSILKYENKDKVHLNTSIQQIINNIQFNEDEKSIKEKILQGISDLTSFINFYSDETYFTRASFLDVVINTQMCSNRFELKDTDYICSILENSGFFFLHSNKTKYLIRIMNSLNSLVNKTKKYNDILSNDTYFIQFKNIINSLKSEKQIFIDGKMENIIDYDDKYCKWTTIEKNDTSFDLLRCQKYALFNIILHINFTILNTVKDDLNIKHDFIFYNSFVKTDTNILGKSISNIEIRSEWQ